jgi:hypothetical protein
VVAGLPQAFRAGTLPRDLSESPMSPPSPRGFGSSFATTASSPPSPSSAAQSSGSVHPPRRDSNRPLVNVTADQVTSRWKDYRHGSQVRLLTLSAEEFLRRFCVHVLPKSFRLDPVLRLSRTSLSYRSLASPVAGGWPIGNNPSG